MKLIQLKNDERGIGHVLLVVLAVVIAGIIGFAGYTVMNKNNITPAETVATKAAAAECVRTYHDKTLCKFTGNYDISKLSYKLVITSTGESNGTMTMLSDGKGNSSVNTSGGGAEYATISLNGDTYMKGTDGTWIHYPKNDATAPKQSDPTSDVKFNSSAPKDAEKNTVSYKSLGKEKCGNLSCYKYQVVDTSQPDVTQYVWFDTKDYRMQRFSTKDSHGTSDMVMTYQKVTISKPSPVKEFDPNAGIDTHQIEQLQQQIDAQSPSVDDGSQ